MTVFTNYLSRSVAVAFGVVIVVFASIFFWSTYASTAPLPGISLDEFTTLTASGALHPNIDAEQISSNCPSYTDSAVTIKRRHSVTTGPDENWISVIEKAAPHTEILLMDGDYRIDRHAVNVADHITIRSLSGNRDQVTIVGAGYSIAGEGFMIVGSDVTIADLSITDIRDHAISIKPELGAKSSIQIYNVHLYDIGTQHIKLNVGGSANGLVACSSIGYSANGAVGDYNGAVDLHQAHAWTVRDNLIYNIRGDGSGCNVDRDCGRYYSGPAILIWNKSENNRITRNRIFDSYRNIALGLGKGHANGIVDNNIIVQSRPGDAGVELQTAVDTIVEQNTVILAGSYPGAIEYRNSKNITLRHNQLTSKPHDRGKAVNVQLESNSVDLRLFSTLVNSKLQPTE